MPKNPNPGFTLSHQNSAISLSLPQTKTLESQGHQTSHCCAITTKHKMQNVNNNPKKNENKDDIFIYHVCKFGCANVL
jgi:hypothetical protein